MNRVFGINVDKANRERIFNWILLGMGLLIAVVVAVFCFIHTDTKQATPEDYESLVNRVSLIQRDPTKMFQENGKIIMNDDTILLVLENKECEIRTAFNRNFQLQTMEPIDKAVPVYIALILSILLGVTFGILCVLVIKIIQTIIIATKNFTWLLVCKLKKKEKGEEH